MNDKRSTNPQSNDEDEELTELELLLRLDLATEVLEGLDQLGIADRQQLQALLERLERRIQDAG